MALILQEVVLTGNLSVMSILDNGTCIGVRALLDYKKSSR